MVAAIYGSYDAAERRAKRLSAQWSGPEIRVHPERGQGKRYRVLLGSGMTREEAERLVSQARSKGMPGDTFATQLR